MTPKTVSYRGRHLNLAGSGRSPGSHLYVELLTGTQYELFSGAVTATGPSYAQVRVHGNAALARVRVAHAVTPGPLLPGDRVLVGPLAFGAGPPAAAAAWLLGLADPPAPRRHTGVIVEAHGTYGRIRDGRGRTLFVHANDARGVPLVVGLRVSFRVGSTPRGPKALDVRAA
jgi:hypothetical protein